MSRVTAGLALFVALFAACTEPTKPTDTTGMTVNREPRTGSWRAWLDSPGGDLPFGLELTATGRPAEDVWSAVISNGQERIEVPRVEVRANGELVLGIDHYDAEVRAHATRDGTRLDGSWRRRSAGPDNFSELLFHAEYGAAARFPELATAAGDSEADAVAGRWAVDFASDDDPAVAVFEEAHDGTVAGTFLTDTGDYRYLAGAFAGGELRLSVFDGAHAFLFIAHLQDDGSWSGDFWSRDVWHDTWTARRDDDIELRDPFTLSQWTAGTDLALLRYRDPRDQGRERALDDPVYRGRARIIELFGTWCPNCKDAARYLAELDERYGERGLEIQGLAFEHTGDYDRDAEQVRRYAAHHGIGFPLLVAGVSDKAEASKSFPALDQVRAYPTLIFLDDQDRVAGIYTGFSGPATGEAHQRMRGRIEEIIERLLAIEG